MKRLDVVYTFVFQASGAVDISFLRDEFVSNVSFCYDYKSEQTLVPFNVNLGNLTERDELKFVFTPDNAEEQAETVRKIVEQNSKVHIIITSESRPGEEEQWKELTEALLQGHMPINKDQIHILPRLQQLYWPYAEGR